MLGAGGFGITYLALDNLLHKWVALKEYFYAAVSTRKDDGVVVPATEADSNAFLWGRRRFLEEARTLAKLDHPNIVRVHRFLRANNTAYIVMEYVEGQSLAEILFTHHALAPDKWWSYLLPLLNALEYVHSHHGHLHRDLKPANIIIRATGDPILVDFGAARQSASAQTGDVTALFTPGYTPIEQYSSGDQGPPADIYSLAAVSYHALTGQPPPAATERQVADRHWHLGDRLGRPYDGFLAAIDRALAIDANRRPQTVAAWRVELKRAFENLVRQSDDPLIQRGAWGGSTWAQSQVLPWEPMLMYCRNDVLAALHYKRRAEKGDADAQFALGARLAAGLGLRQDLEEALTWFQKSTASRTQEPNCVRPEFPSPASSVGLFVAASAGDVDAQYRVGMIASFPDAEFWLRRAAERGHADAQYEFGVLLRSIFYEHGLPEQAATWLLRAADQGHASAKHELGWLYEQGQCDDLGYESVPQDEAQAVDWYRQAAIAGHTEAQFELGQLYETGKIVDKDSEAAANWYCKAAERQHVEAMFRLAELLLNDLGSGHSVVEAANLFRKASDHNHPKASYRLAELCANGIGVRKNTAQALLLFQKACDQPKWIQEMGWVDKSPLGVLQTPAEWKNRKRHEGSLDRMK